MPRAASNGGTSRRQRSEQTADRILDVAEQLVQVRGYNAFSYADVASELGITKAALHYHYPGKAELGSALIARYAQRFGLALQEIDARAGGAPAKLEAYAGLYAEVLDRERMCLCGMLAAENETLPVHVREAVVEFFDSNEAWLTRVLEEGSRERALSFEGTAREKARLIVSGLEGAMLLARTYGDQRRFRACAKTLLATLTPVSHSTAP